MTVSAQPTPVAGGTVEVDIALDIAKRGLVVAPIAMGLGFAMWGQQGLWSVGLGMVVVLVNFLLAAWLVSTAAKISLALMTFASLFGFILRLGLVAGAFFLVRDSSLISPVAFGAAIIVTHLALLVWELRYIKISLAFSGVASPGKQPSSDPLT